MSRNLIWLAALLLAVATAGPAMSPVAHSDDASGPKQADGKANDKAANAAREKAALAFAAEHHPELATLIRQLRRMNPDAYQKAIQDLSRASERISRFEERAPERYAVELALWKLDSRIRLLAAQSAMSDADDRREQIRELLLERADVRLEHLQQERARLLARVERLDRSIEELQTRRSEVVEKELTNLLKSARSRAAEKRTSARRKAPADSPKAGATDRSRKPAATEEGGSRGTNRKAPQ
ncbi:hypothetical protein Mal4_50800 [Maioricimonas rarisocia]|uniref:Chromosome partition protein Smc n=1 Tax=Maioricimonas rarisocia TaxID=2528026 RepID=A0A517ZE54_9PLAN|nr:hypothetical protein [Maioricimonas rarisocia]QDU40720.1 hypothetical protein Mal4_50800 [Maioricimonas rarisocia]